MTLVGAWLVGVMLLAALYPILAYRFHPLALPVLLIAGAAAVISISRPEIGISGALFLASLNPGLVGVRPWLPGAVAAVFVFVVVLGARSHLLIGPALPPLALVTLLYLAVLVAGVVVARDPGQSVPIVRSALTGVMLFFAIAVGVRSRSQVGWVLAGATGGAMVVGGYAAWQYLTGATVSSGFFSSSGELIGRVDGGFGGANQLGGFLVILVPLAMAGIVVHRAGKLYFVAAGGLAIFGTYASFSRGALLGLAIIPLVLLRDRVALLVLPVLAVVAVLATPALIRERFATSTNQGTELAGRVDVWRTAGAIWTEHPIFGAGVGSFPLEYAEARVPGKQFLPETEFEPPPHAHNLFLQLLAEQGLVGLISFGSVLAVAISRCRRLRTSATRWIQVMGSALLASILAFLVHNQFDVTLLEGTGIYVWAILGLLSAVVSIDRAENEEREISARASV